MAVKNTPGHVILLLGSLLSSRVASPAQPPSKPAAVDPSSKSTLVLPEKDQSRRSPSSYPDKIVLVGFVKRGENVWHVALKDTVYGETAFVHDGEVAFGYRVKEFSLDSKTVILEGAGREFELRAGDDSKPAHPTNPIVLPQWLNEWRARLASLPPTDQQGERETMREYWRQQWEAGLAYVVSQLPRDEQIRFREELSRLWREEARLPTPNDKIGE